MDTTVADTLIGALVDGRYRITGRVARVAWRPCTRAVDERLERTVALKIIHPSQAHDAHFVDRFTDEAKTIARLTHPNVVAVYDQGTHEGLPYLVMEYVRGRTLRELLAERRRLSPVEALAIWSRCSPRSPPRTAPAWCTATSSRRTSWSPRRPAAASRNLVDSVVKVADFGLARAVEASADESGAAHGDRRVRGARAGHRRATPTPAPTSTRPASCCSRCSPAGCRTTATEPVDVAWQHVDHDVPRAVAVRPAACRRVLDDLVARATRRDPGARPTDAGAMLAEVQAAREDLGAANVETALLRQVPARHRCRRWRATEVSDAHRRWTGRPGPGCPQQAARSTRSRRTTRATGRHRGWPSCSAPVTGGAR